MTVALRRGVGHPLRSGFDAAQHPGATPSSPGDDGSTSPAASNECHCGSSFALILETRFRSRWMMICRAQGPNQPPTRPGVRGLRDLFGRISKLLLSETASPLR